MRIVAAIIVTLGLLAAATLGYVALTGLSAHPQPGPLEGRLARAVRSVAIPKATRDRRNPAPDTAASVNDGLEHFADHCATCHANDGRGNTEIGRGLYPKPPDMRTAVTQQLTDGELFYIIENGVRFTGMPAFGTGRPADEDSTWRLVRFIRHLPHLTQAELEHMQALNPRSPEEIRQEIEEQQFLNGGSGQ